MSVFQKKEKDIKIAFISPKQMSSDMDGNLSNTMILTSPIQIYKKPERF